MKRYHFCNFIGMKLMLACVILLTFAENAKSQSINLSQGSFSAHIVPLVFFDANPRIRFGIEYHGYNRLGYNLEIGFGNSTLNKARLKDPVWGEKYSFFEIRPEVKWYTAESRKYESYFSGEVFYSHMTDKLINQYYYPEESFEVVSFTEASFKRKKIGLLIKHGTKWILSERVVFDVSSGFGLAHRNISYSGLVNATVVEPSPIEEWWSPPRRHEGQKIIGQVIFGFKLGIIIGK